MSARPDEARDRVPTRPAPARPRRRKDAMVPDQHGAWAFLVTPLLLGLTVSGWSWLLLPLLLAWVAAYPFSWALTGRLAAPRPQRFDRPLVLWSALVVPPAVLLVVLRPWLVWAGLGFLALFAVNLWFARARAERALLNDLVLVAECVAVVPLTVGVAAGERTWTPPWEPMGTTEVGVLTLACALTLVGSTLHVKSLIRERRRPEFGTLSRAFAVACLPAVLLLTWAAGWGLPLLVPFALLAARGFWLAGSTWRPARLGMVELACFVVLVGTAALL